jgi:hypothetical protein
MNSRPTTRSGVSSNVCLLVHRCSGHAADSSRPRPDRNRSENMPPGHNRWRIAARNAPTESSDTRRDKNAAAPINSTFGSALPCIRQFSYTQPRTTSLSRRNFQQSPRQARASQLTRRTERTRLRHRRLGQAGNPLRQTRCQHRRSPAKTWPAAMSPVRVPV